MCEPTIPWTHRTLQQIMKIITLPLLAALVCIAQSASTLPIHRLLGRNVNIIDNSHALVRTVENTSDLPLRKVMLRAIEIRKALPIDPGPSIPPGFFGPGPIITPLLDEEVSDTDPESDTLGHCGPESVVASKLHFGPGPIKLPSGVGKGKGVLGFGS